MLLCMQTSSSVLSRIVVMRSVIFLFTCTYVAFTSFMKQWSCCSGIVHFHLLLLLIIAAVQQGELRLLVLLTGNSGAICNLCLKKHELLFDLEDIKLLFFYVDWHISFLRKMQQLLPDSGSSAYSINVK